MIGEKLYTKYLSYRDFSGSDEDSYAQLLQTIESGISIAIYSLLEKAESSGKKPSIKEDNNLPFGSEITTDSIILA